MTNAIETSVGPRAVIDGRERDYFAGCSYLGLQNHPSLIAAAADALQRYGLGTATSRGGYGEHPVYVALEAAAARYFGTEAALYYVTAYLGNTILLQGLRGEYDRVFMDDASHFSVRDSVQIAGVPVTVVPSPRPRRPGGAAQRPAPAGRAAVGHQRRRFPHLRRDRAGAGLSSRPGSLSGRDPVPRRCARDRRTRRAGAGDGGVLARERPDRFAKPVRSAGDQRAYVEQGVGMPRRRDRRRCGADRQARDRRLSFRGAQPFAAAGGRGRRAGA